MSPVVGTFPRYRSPEVVSGRSFFRVIPDAQPDVDSVPERCQSASVLSYYFSAWHGGFAWTTLVG